MDASVTDELVADHEWEALLHNFEHETDELSPGGGGGGGEEGEELWERLSSTRWLKAPAPVDLPRSSTSASSDTSETTAIDAELGI